VTLRPLLRQQELAIVWETEANARRTTDADDGLSEQFRAALGDGIGRSLLMISPDESFRHTLTHDPDL
jgi:hypothetical protein